MLGRLYSILHGRRAASHLWVTAPLICLAIVSPFADINSTRLPSGRAITYQPVLAASGNRKFPVSKVKNVDHDAMHARRESGGN